MTSAMSTQCSNQLNYGNISGAHGCEFARSAIIVRHSVLSLAFFQQDALVPLSGFEPPCTVSLSTRCRREGIQRYKEPLDGLEPSSPAYQAGASPFML